MTLWVVQCRSALVCNQYDSHRGLGFDGVATWIQTQTPIPHPSGAFRRGSAPGVVEQAGSPQDGRCRRRHDRHVRNAHNHSVSQHASTGSTYRSLGGGRPVR